MFELSQDLMVTAQRFILSLLLVLSILVIVYLQGIEIKKDIIISAIRGFIQLLILASIIFFVFTLEDVLPLVLILFVMILFGSLTIAQRFDELPNVFLMLFMTLCSSVIAVLGFALVFSIIPFTGEFFIPIGGMITGNAMNMAYLTINRLTTDIKNRKNQIESALALGLHVNVVLRDLGIKSASIKNGITPTLNNLKTLGLVFIPGLMSGMIIAGINPIVAAFYQIIIFFLLLLAGLLASVISSYLVIGYIFDKHTHRLL